MNKAIAKAVLERSKGLCEVCQRPGQHLHHIIHGNGKRKQCETIESVINLCWSCHQGTKGVHGRDGRKLDLRLKLKLQETYTKQGHPEDEIRRMMGGKIYARPDPGNERNQTTT